MQDINTLFPDIDLEWIDYIKRFYKHSSSKDIILKIKELNGNYPKNLNGSSVNNYKLCILKSRFPRSDSATLRTLISANQCIDQISEILLKDSQVYDKEFDEFDLLDYQVRPSKPIWLRISKKSIRVGRI